MGNEFWAAIVGAVLGSVVGGFIAYCIQTVALRAAANQREKEERERKQALGYALLFKMIKIYSTLDKFGRDLEGMFAVAEKEGSEREPWQIYLPHANLPAPVHFSTDEMAMLLSLKDDDLFNELVSLDAVHNSILDIFQTLNARRQALTDGLPAKMSGATGSTELTADQLLFLRPKMVEINLLVVSAREWCKKEGQTSRKLLLCLQEILKNKLGLTTKLSFNADE